MAVRWTKGEEGSVVSWGSANFYSSFLALLSSNRAAVYIGSDVVDVQAFGAYAAARTPGLKQCRATISGYAGSTPYLGNAGLLAYSSGGYVLHAQRWSWSASSGVDDITEFNATPPEWRSFMPDGFQADCEFTAGIDADTALALPPAPQIGPSALPTLTLTYRNGGTLAAKAVIQSVNATIPLRGKNLAAYNVLGTGIWTAAGASSLFGSRTFASAVNQDPFWSVGGAAAGALVIQAASGRTYSFADSFWTRMQLTAEVGSPVRVDVSVQGTGVLTAA